MRRMMMHRNYRMSPTGKGKVLFALIVIGIFLGIIIWEAHVKIEIQQNLYNYMMRNN
jgi:hypothetical protein